MYPRSGFGKVEHPAKPPVLETTLLRTPESLLISDLITATVTETDVDLNHFELDWKSSSNKMVNRKLLQPREASTLIFEVRSRTI